MSETLPPGTVLQEKWEILEVIGSSEGRALYLAQSLGGVEQVFVWESKRNFDLETEPPGLRTRFEEGENHYLVTDLENQNLALLLGAAGKISEKWAVSWMSQICRGAGNWHKRKDEPVIFLTFGDLSLSDLRILGDNRALLPSYYGLRRSPDPDDQYVFSAPEKESGELSPRSDVYALGAALYTLATGQGPPPAWQQATAQAHLPRPQEINPEISGWLQISP